MKTIAFCIALLFAASLIGCKPKAPPISGEQVVGSWVHSVELSREDAMSSEIQEQIAKIGRMALELSSDHTFTLTVAGDTSSGTWEAVESQIVLTYASVESLVLGDGNTVRLHLVEGGLETEPSTSGATWLFTRPPD